MDTDIGNSYVGIKRQGSKITMINMLKHLWVNMMDKRMGSFRREMKIILKITKWRL